MIKDRSSYIFIDSQKSQIEARLSCEFKKRGKWHFAECHELDLIDQGLSQGEAFDNLVEMVVSILLDALNTGKLEAILKGYGFKKRKVPLPERMLFEYDKPVAVIPMVIKWSFGKEIRNTGLIAAVG